MLFERMCVFSEIQFTKHFIVIVFVETNKLVRSNSNVMLTQKTWSQRLSRVAGRKRLALAFHFLIRIWYVFLISKCRGESDLGLCMTSELAKRMRLSSGDFLFQNVFGHKIRRMSALLSRILFASSEVMHRPRSDSLLHFDIKNSKHIGTGK